jgi:ADP-heptose:LPS heptosyltransferase
MPRVWPKLYWIELVKMIKNAGLHVKVVFEHPDRSFSFVHYISEETLPYVSAAIQKSRLVIGNDSGPAHLAGTLGVPTLAIQGPTTERIFAYLPEVTSLRKVSVGCAGCHCLPSKDPAKLGWRESCEFGCAELYRTFPEEAFEVAMKMINHKTEEKAA